MGRHCFSHKYGIYATLEDSKLACFKDANCLGVYDNDCDKQPPFGLCPTSYDYEDSKDLPVSCVYDKLGDLNCNVKGIHR